MPKEIECICTNPVDHVKGCPVFNWMNGVPDTTDLAVMRHLLASIDLEDIEDEKMSESERKEYNGAISAVFPRLEKDIKRFLHTQLMFVSNQATDMNQISFGRGTYNGMAILLEHWKKAHLEHTVVEPKEDFDKHEVVGEL